MTDDEVRQVNLFMGLEYFSMGQRKFQDAWKQVVFSLLQAGITFPEQYTEALDNAMQDPAITPEQRQKFISHISLWADNLVAQSED